MSYKGKISNSRDIGLDFIRSLAITCVLIAHFSMFFSSHMDISPIIHGFGFFGVELFFVLSGFLIGRILISEVVQNNTFASLLNFWKRRWYRTLPAYYLVWSILFYRSDYSTSNLVHLFMLQNLFYGPRDLFFGVSWSLAAEEWFYLFVPLIIHILLKIRKFNNSKLLIYICMIGVILAPLLRFIAAVQFNQEWGDIRKSSFIRLDAFLFGILISSVKHYFLSMYTFVKKRERLLLLLSIVGISFCATKFRHMEKIETIFNKTILFSISDFFVAPLIIFCDSNKFFNKWKNSWKEKLIYFFSVTSYSVYLIHWDIMIAFRSYKFNAASIGLVTILLLLCLSTTYALAFTMYKFWERPFLKIRDTDNFTNRLSLIKRT